MRIYARVLVVLAACTLSAKPAPAQTHRRALEKGWAKTYGSPSPYEGLFDLRRASNGSIHVAGYTSAFGASSSSGWLLHLNQTNGRVRAQNVVGNTLGGTVDGAAIAADGGALFTGRVVLDLFTKHDAWLVRVDPMGIPLWSRGFTTTGFGRYFLLDAVELGSGAWVAAGVTSTIDQPPQSAWVVRLSPDGTIDWRYEYGAGVSEHVQALASTSNGGVVLAGWTNSSGAGSDDAWIMKLDATGAIEWQQTYGGSDIDQATNIVELADGGFAVAAQTRSFTASGYAPWVLRLDAQGNVLWHVIADGVWGDVQSIAETDAGGVIALGRVGQAGFPSNDMWAVELSPNGSVRWQRAYEGLSGDWGSAAVALSGSRFAFGGTWGWGFPEEDIWVLRTGREGRLPGCGIDRVTAFPLISPAILAQPGQAVRQASGAIERSFDFESDDSDADIAERCD
jgi:hypothetical protein